MAGRRVPGPAGVPCLPWCLELWVGPCRESSEWLAGPNFTVRRWAHSTWCTGKASMGQIPLFSLSGLDNCWYTPSRGSPCWSLGPSPSGGSSRFWLAWGLCTVLLFPVPSLPPPSAQSPVPARLPAMPCPVLPCLAMPCPMPCLARALVSHSLTWKVPALPPLPS